MWMYDNCRKFEEFLGCGGGEGGIGTMTRGWREAVVDAATGHISAS